VDGIQVKGRHAPCSSAADQHCQGYAPCTTTKLGAEEETRVHEIRRGWRQRVLQHLRRPVRELCGAGVSTSASASRRRAEGRTCMAVSRRRSQKLRRKRRLACEGRVEIKSESARIGNKASGCTRRRCIWHEPRSVTCVWRTAQAQSSARGVHAMQAGLAAHPGSETVDVEIEICTAAALTRRKFAGK
jgi:hypothetical protein